MTPVTGDRIELTVQLRVLDVEAEDIPDLDWSGGAAHLRALGRAWQDAVAGEVALLMVVTEPGATIACGAVRFETGVLWMLAVRDGWRSLGVGTALIRALESRLAAHGVRTAELWVEHDNPDARRLYERLGYRAAGERTDSWETDDGGVWTTPVTVLRRPLGRPGG